ncbi:MAG TPA: cation:proton antiporter [Methanocorpusculum sp.]|nr:cation:proton antiporter [Methanocorpusculum sp.]HJK11317.1 cation:proton antiporter [Methanocorpusculum sp.]HJK13045.1 cation:proton antiporter [Methanocorpusculum sp.]HJK13643.1 cation:proton antiporter [Methanocorpusculum sp.]HJK21236.1 cation:proton antiporter [Methanocorpusculum sp.]
MMEDITSTVEFQMSLLLFVALGGYLLATRIHQSAVIGEILVGLIVGPSVLGLITYTDFVQSLAGLGAIILLFVIGFEFELSDITNWRYGVIALIGVIIPWIGGYATSLFFNMDFYTAIFIGTALTATSIAITANVLREMGKLHQPFAKAIIGAAVIDDILSLIVLSICKDLGSTGELVPMAVLLTVIKSIGFVVIAAVVGIKVIPPLISKMDTTKLARQFPEFVFIFAMMVAFFYAMMAESVGVSAIVGAFLAGVCVNRVSLKHSLDIKLGAEYLYIIFAAIFFVSLGIIVDLQYLFEKPEMLWFIIALIAVAIITKVIGCGLPARILGMNTRDSLIIGFGMAPRGEVAMIVGLIALTHFQEMAEAATDVVQKEYLLQLGNEVFIAIVLMSLVTTVIVPLVYRGWFFKAEKKPDPAVGIQQ